MSTKLLIPHRIIKKTSAEYWIMRDSAKSIRDYIITKILHVCLDHILHFHVYKITLDNIVSLETSNAAYLKTRHLAKLIRDF